MLISEVKNRGENSILKQPTKTDWGKDTHEDLEREISNSNGIIHGKLFIKLCDWITIQKCLMFFTLWEQTKSLDPVILGLRLSFV